MEWFRFKAAAAITIGAAAVAFSIARQVSLKSTEKTTADITAQLIDLEQKYGSAKARLENVETQLASQTSTLNGQKSYWAVTQQYGWNNAARGPAAENVAITEAAILSLQTSQLQDHDELNGLSNQIQDLLLQKNDAESGTSTKRLFSFYAVAIFSTICVAIMIFCLSIFSSSRTKPSVSKRAKEVFDQCFTILTASFVAYMLYLGYPMNEALKWFYGK